MANVSLRVPEELKKQMDELSWINWSEVLRRAIMATISREKGNNLAQAVLVTEKLRKSPGKNWDSTEEIRKWRYPNA